MIEEEILNIVADPADDGTRLNEIAYQFCSGRDVSELIALLDSDNAELVWSGAWIISELPFELYSAEEFVSRLRGLTSHTEPTIRFTAFNALFPALSPHEKATHVLIQKLLNDPNPGVRKAAEAAAAQLFPK